MCYARTLASCGQGVPGSRAVQADPANRSVLHEHNLPLNFKLQSCQDWSFRVNWVQRGHLAQGILRSEGGCRSGRSLDVTLAPQRNQARLQSCIPCSKLMICEKLLVHGRHPHQRVVWAFCSLRNSGQPCTHPGQAGVGQGESTRRLTRTKELQLRIRLLTREALPSSLEKAHARLRNDLILSNVLHKVRSGCHQARIHVAPT